MTAIRTGNAITCTLTVLAALVAAGPAAGHARPGLGGPHRPCGLRGTSAKLRECHQTNLQGQLRGAALAGESFLTSWAI